MELMELRTLDPDLNSKSTPVILAITIKIITVLFYEIFVANNTVITGGGPPPKPLSEIAVAVEAILGVKNVAICGLEGYLDSSVVDFRDKSEEPVEEACEVESEAFDVTFEGDISTALMQTSTPSSHPQSSVPAPSSSCGVGQTASPSTVHVSMSAENSHAPPAKRLLFPLPEDTFRAMQQKAELALLEAKKAAADAKRKSYELEAQYKSLLISQLQASLPR
ncbi:uncharacterized protein LOC135197453 [Macrobrachium nipponense]|uniref:uncharacterized protein LOC135197453 n=1 Tax=Macrobrachium nipponense TaxID=159736 RepID=UPI0030C8B044